MAAANVTAKALPSVGFLGAGHIAHAMIRGFLRAGIVSSENLVVSSRTRQSADSVKVHGVQHSTTSNREVAERCKILLAAVKPHSMSSVLKDISPVLTKDHLFISLAAGVTSKKIERHLPGGSKVIRCMPNTPVSVRNGVSIFSAGSHVQAEDMRLVSEMLDSVGISFEVEEYNMDIMTGLSGCGPTYMYMTMDALADGGVYAGIPKKMAIQIAAHTMIGAAKMVLENGDHPVELKDDVCSPAGTSIQAVRVMEKAGYRGILMEAVHAACRRAAQLADLKNGEDTDKAIKQ